MRAWRGWRNCPARPTTSSATIPRSGGSTSPPTRRSVTARSIPVSTSSTTVISGSWNTTSSCVRAPTSAPSRFASRAPTKWKSMCRAISCSTRPQAQYASKSPPSIKSSAASGRKSRAATYSRARIRSASRSAPMTLAKRWSSTRSSFTPPTSAAAAKTRVPRSPWTRSATPT